MAGIFSRLQGENDSTSGTDVNHYDVDPAKAKRMCLVYFGQDNAGNRQWKIKGNDTHVGSDGVLKDADGRPIMPIYAYQIALADDNATYCQKKEDNTDSTDNTETTANPDDTETTPYEPYIPPVNNAPKTTPNVNYYYDRNGNLVYNDIADTRLVTDKTQLFAPPPPVKLKQPTPLPPNQQNIFNVTDKTHVTDKTDILSRTPYKDNAISNKQQNVIAIKSTHNPETQSTATASSDKGPGTRVFKYHASDYNRPEYVHNDGSRNVFICYRLANVQSVIKILKKYSGKSDPFYIYAGEKDSLVNLGVWYDLDSFEHFAQRWMNHPYHVAAVDGHINLSDVYDITLNGAAWLPPLGEVAKGMNLYGNCILSSAVDDPIMVNQHGQSDVEGIAGSLIIGVAPIIMHELGKIKESEYDVMEYKYLKNGAEHTGKSEGSNGPTGADYHIQAGFRIDDLRTIRGVVVDRHFLYLYYGNILLPGTGIKMEIPRIKNDYKYSYSEDGSIVVVSSPQQAAANTENVPEKPKKEAKGTGDGTKPKQDVKLITEKTGVTDTSEVTDKKPVIGGKGAVIDTKPVIMKSHIIHHKHFSGRAGGISADGGDYDEWDEVVPEPEPMPYSIKTIFLDSNSGGFLGEHEYKASIDSNPSLNSSDTNIRMISKEDYDKLKNNKQPAYVGEPIKVNLEKIKQDFEKAMNPNLNFKHKSFSIEQALVIYYDPQNNEITSEVLPDDLNYETENSAITVAFSAFVHQKITKNLLVPKDQRAGIIEKLKIIQNKKGEFYNVDVNNIYNEEIGGTIRFDNIEKAGLLVLAEAHTHPYVKQPKRESGTVYTSTITVNKSVHSDLDFQMATVKIHEKNRESFLIPQIIIDIGDANNSNDVRIEMLTKNAKDFNDVKPVISNNNFINIKRQIEDFIIKIIEANGE